MLAQNTQQQYEDAYVQQQLMDKYLKQNLAQQGLADSGIANLYAQQNNTNYMNQRADIAKTNMLAEQDLYDKYTQAVQEKQKDFFDLAVKKVDNSVSKLDGKLSDDDMMALRNYFETNKSQLGDSYYDMVNQYIDNYQRTEEEKNIYEDTNYENYLKQAQGKIGEGNTLNDDDYDSLIIELDKVRSKIGEDNYNNAKQTLTAYKVMGDIVERLDSNQRINSIDYRELKAAVEELNKSGMLSSTDYKNLLKALEEIKTTVEQEKVNYNKEIQQYLQDSLYNTTGDAYDLALAQYQMNSDDAALEKILRSSASRFTSTFKGLGENIAKLWNKYIFN